MHDTTRARARVARLLAAVALAAPPAAGVTSAVAVRLAAPVPASLVASVAAAAAVCRPVHAADGDENGIDDDDELILARKFCPSVQLHGPETRLNGIATPVYPAPVEIMGLASAQPGEGLPADRLFVYWQMRPLDYPDGHHWVGAAGWTPPLPEGDPQHNYSALTDEPPALRSGIAPPGMPTGSYWLRFHWEYGGNGINEPHEWYDVWQHGNAWTRPGAAFRPTVYAHLFRCDVEGCDPGAPVGPTAAVIQYWFFFPFNDWVNNHEGDWEGVNVLLSSVDPGEAAITEVETFLHKYYIAREPFHYPALDDHVVVIDETHPVVFLGGHGYEEGCIGGTGSGEGSHGLCPTFGRWPAAGGADPIGCFAPADEVIDHRAGPYVHWRDFDVLVIPDHDAPNLDYDARPSAAWLAADLRWGTRRVPSVGGDILSDAGNRSPHGPVYNTEDRWNRTAIGSTADAYVTLGLPRQRPYHPAAGMGWVPFALFLDPFTGETDRESSALSGWSFGEGNWQVVQGALEGQGGGAHAITNRATFTFERPPSWYELPFVELNERATRLACDVSAVGAVPEATQVGVVVQGGENEVQQVRVAWRRQGGAWELCVLSTVDGGMRYTVHAAAPVEPLDGAARRLEVLSLDRAGGGRAFHDVWVDGELTLSAVATPAIGDDARALVVDGAARARFDRVSVSFLRMERDYRHPPFAVWTAAPATGDTVGVDPWLLAWEAVDEKADDGISSQRIELTTDGGSGWLAIADLDGDRRSFTWWPQPPPQPVAARLRLVVEDVEADSRSVITDTFVLAPSAAAAGGAARGDPPSDGRARPGSPVPGLLLRIVGQGGAAAAGGHGDGREPGAGGCEDEVAPRDPAGAGPGLEIIVSLPQDSRVRLRVVGVTGRVVRRLIDGDRLGCGTHHVRWDLHDDGGARVATGVYLCVLEACERRLAAKAWVVR